MLEGGCLCGAVRYRIDGEPEASGLCHCRTCQRAASAPVLPFLTVAIRQFAITQGTPVDYRSSPPVTRSFCGRCGSPLTYRIESHPHQLDVMTCSLDNPDAAPPQFTVWAGHKPGWAVTDPALPTFPQSRDGAG